MQCIVKIINWSEDIMKTYILGICIFIYGAIGTIITCLFKLIDELEYGTGWLNYFLYGDNWIPFIYFMVWMMIGILICIRNFD